MGHLHGGMRCLTPAEVSSWLAAHELPADPYNQPDTSPTHYLQRAIPHDLPRVSDFTRSTLAEITGDGPVLILMTDWDHYQPEEMEAIATIRERHGETRWLIDAPGNLLEPGETETTTELFSLATFYQWTCYLHAPATGAIFLSWEGDLLDFWTEDAAQLARVENIAESHGFTATPLPPS
jgi:hypothetical protein